MTSFTHPRQSCWEGSFESWFLCNHIYIDIPLDLLSRPSWFWGKEDEDWDQSMLSLPTPVMQFVELVSGMKHFWHQQYRLVCQTLLDTKGLEQVLLAIEKYCMAGFLLFLLQFQIQRNLFSRKSWWDDREKRLMFIAILFAENTSMHMSHSLNVMLFFDIRRQNLKDLIKYKMQI